MLQDIYPHHFDNVFKKTPPEKKDYLFIVDRDKIWLAQEAEGLTLPTIELGGQYIALAKRPLIYLFSVDGKGVYMLEQEDLPEFPGFKKEGSQIFRELSPGWMAFAGITACHLSRWYKNRRYCGHCQTAMNHSDTERAMVCPVCGNIEYPKISPVVIVGIIHGNKIVMTKYARGLHQRYALVAGFMEIGESFEDTVRREVMEEVGLEVENIRYYKSQPWGFSDSLLAGFFCDLKGSPEIKLDLNELSEGVWMEREDIPLDGNNISLTYAMMEAFKMGYVN